MWQLKEISAKNICAFRELRYTPLQGHTTLVFGNNLDNDSQGSNGSGKSALIEAFAIALTGDTLRKVGVEEIINDLCDEAEVSCVLANTCSGDIMKIMRSFSRTAPQSVSLEINGEADVQPSVLEYNRHILGLIGLGRDDIFCSFILSKYKYTSFLNASDRSKKELINRFSNGSLVDESVGILNADKDKVAASIVEISKQAAGFEGRIASIDEQIEAWHAEKSARERKRRELVEAHREAIGRMNGKIRAARGLISDYEVKLDALDMAGEAFEEMESTPMSVEECYAKITAIKTRYNIAGRPLKDYGRLSGDLAREYEERSASAKAFAEEAKKAEAELAALRKDYGDLLASRETLHAANTPISARLHSEVDAAFEQIGSLSEANDGLLGEISKLQKSISHLNNALAGTIECPKCGHRFLLESGHSVKELERQAERETKALRKLERQYGGNEENIRSFNAAASKNRQQIAELDRQEEEMSRNVSTLYRQGTELQKSLQSLQAKAGAELEKAGRLQSQIVSLRKELFDDAFDMIDSLTRRYEVAIKQSEGDIEVAQSNISNYTDAIKELEETADTEAVDKLEERKRVYLDQLNECQEALQIARSEEAGLVEQEARFASFKTHLANSKIEALGRLTNEFLEAIGSDIRISFSGYTMFKSGKVRDKISISLLRDGIDCGSFGKFSAGEQCRVNLASILALHKLTNMNCPDGKGLDLLILDEILEAADESGLASMFDALNTLQITSLVVSHGQIAEAYPYRLTVTKQNGISTLDGQNA